MPDGPLVVRDFVYLDWDRVRSLAAQLFRGVPEEIRQEVGSDAAKHGELSGGLPGILKGQASDDFRYFQSETETRSLHHHVYSLVEAKMMATRLAATLDAVPREWVRDNFHDGEFVRVSGLLRIMDYEWLAGTMDGLPTMMRAAFNATSIGLKKKRDAGEITQPEFAQKQRDQEKQLADIKAFKLEDITTVIRQLYGDTIRVKVVPDRDHMERVLVGSAKVSNFSDPPASLSQKYGFEVDAGWTVLGQVNLSKDAEDPKPVPIGNSMEDAFEQVALAFNGLNKIASSVQFPAVSFTPIAIYRAVTPPK